MEEKKTVADVLIERLLEDVDKEGLMPWQRPYRVYYPFNWVTKKVYRGINRLILPMGEYLTKNQINEINKSKGQDYRFAKGIKWYPVVYFTNDERKESVEKVLDIVSKSAMDVDPNKVGYLFNYGGRSFYRTDDGQYVSIRKVFKYYNVADRKYFVNSKGETLPSRLETGEIEITKSEPKRVIEEYVRRSGVNIDYGYTGIPCYKPHLDMVCLNPHSKGEDEWFSTAFHELGHSTGAEKRLNRVGVTSSKGDRSMYAAEECIAEICAALCCSECGIYTFSTSESRSYENNLAYVSAWKKLVKDFGKEIIYIASGAEKAFELIVGVEAG